MARDLPRRPPYIVVFNASLHKSKERSGLSCCLAKSLYKRSRGIKTPIRHVFHDHMIPNVLNFEI